MENMDTALVVLVTGLVVVFAVLILLTAIIKIYGTIVSKAQNKTAQAKPSKAAEKTAPKAPVTAAVPAAPAVEAGIPGEVVAAIAAAVVSVSEEEHKGYAVKSIKRTAGSRPVWSMAGLMDNTRPF